MSRLYVLVRRDLPSGLLVAQACHAARLHGKQHPECGPSDDENLIVLQLPDEASLGELSLWLAWELPLARQSAFREPDLAGSLTAIAVEGEKTAETARLLRKALSQLPCALRPPKRDDQAA